LSIVLTGPPGPAVQRVAGTVAASPGTAAANTGWAAAVADTGWGPAPAAGRPEVPAVPADTALRHIGWVVAEAAAAAAGASRLAGAVVQAGHGSGRSSPC
jgi:hypothetical protein